jgi:hypothetical protein
MSGSDCNLTLKISTEPKIPSFHRGIPSFHRGCLSYDRCQIWCGSEDTFARRCLETVICSVTSACLSWKYCLNFAANTESTCWLSRAFRSLFPVTNSRRMYSLRNLVIQDRYLQNFHRARLLVGACLSVLGPAYCSATYAVYFCKATPEPHRETHGPNGHHRRSTLC